MLVLVQVLYNGVMRVYIGLGLTKYAKEVKVTSAITANVDLTQNMI